MKILANDGIAPAGKAQLEEAGFTVVTEKVEQDQLIDAINSENYVGIVVRSATTVRKEVIDACPNLKLIGRAGVGMDNIDVEYARSQGRHVVNTPAASSQSVAELVIGQMFSLSRHLFKSAQEMPEKGASEFKALKKSYKGVELRGKTLGIIGFGRIGQATAKYALGLGMTVVYNNITEEATTTIEVPVGDTTAKVQVDHVSKEELLSKSDYISLHVPKQDDGTPVLGAGEFGQMKEGLRIVNAARGGVIDESALIAALEEGKVAFAALDVFENEPTPRADLLKHDKMTTTPHIGASTVEAQGRIGIEMADQIIKLLKEAQQPASKS